MMLLAHQVMAVKKMRENCYQIGIIFQVRKSHVGTCLNTKYFYFSQCQHDYDDIKVIFDVT